MGQTEKYYRKYRKYKKQYLYYKQYLGGIGMGEEIEKAKKLLMAEQQRQEAEKLEAEKKTLDSEEKI